jgi:ClpP class serine protease
MSIAGETADISIKGVLTAEPNFMAMIFGGGNTTYSDIIAAIASAEQNDSIKNIVLSVDSPGGQIAGLFNAVNAIASAEKPVKAVVSNQAASAAFALIAQADEIVAANEATSVGSVGIRVDMEVDDDVVVITSSEAPKKAPDVKTESGVAVVREQLDAFHDIFASSIAKGRGITTEKVNSDFGRGAMVLAGEAVKRGMIDSISGSIPQAAAASGEDDLTASMVNITAGATPPFKDYPIADKPWDSTAAVRRWREKSGSTEKPSATYKNGFFWYDSEKPEVFGNYKLPFVDIVDGTAKAVRRGVSAANGAMAGARGGVQIPQADRAKVQAHIDKYRDKIAKQDETNATNGKNTREVIGMTKEELQAQHPATFAAVLAMGVEQERDRVSAHLTMAEASGDMATATAAIADGSGMTAKLQATYMAAGMKKNELDARVKDNPDDLNPPPGDGDGPSAEDQVADAVCAALGHDEEVTA